VDFSQIQVFIIETPDSDRSIKLKQSLDGNPRIHFETIPARMISNSVDLMKSGIRVEKDFFWALSNRFMSFPEIGCSYSHNLARQAIAQSSFGGIVFEDDARIINLDLLVQGVSKFLLKNKNESAMLSLTHAVHHDQTTNNQLAGDEYRLFGDAPLAVAYALTPLAAQMLLSANDPIKYVSDWPEAHVRKFCLTYPLVSHGDSETQSVIDPLGTLARTPNNRNLGIAKLLFLDYIFRARGKVGLSIYFNYVFLKPLKFHLDILRMKFVKKSRKV
jgi:hypothetical protein